MNGDHVIITRLCTSNQGFTAKRTKRIEEAIAFEGGTVEHQKKHVIFTFPTGKESYFLKPGKETIRAIPNVYDMLPNVGNINETSETAGWTFEKMWEYLIKISIIHQATFKKILVLLYRNCYLLDHQENEEGNIRYLPTQQILDFINNIETFVLKDGFRDRFETEEIGLLEFLHFIDLIGWNEDMKYHLVNGHPDFESRGKRVGRVNTILSIISAPLEISNFILEVIRKTENRGIINVRLITSTIQRFTKSRGICVLSNKELVEHLSPYLQGGRQLQRVENDDE